MNESQLIKHTVSACRSGVQKGTCGCASHVTGEVSMVFQSSIPNSQHDSKFMSSVTIGRGERTLILLII